MPDQRHPPSFGQWALRTFAPITQQAMRNSLVTGHPAFSLPDTVSRATEALKFKLKICYLETYPPAGYDPNHPKEFYGRQVDLFGIKTQAYVNDLTRMSYVKAFFGWPSNPRDRNDLMSQEGEKQTTKQKAFKCLTYGLWGLAVPFRFVWNTIKIVTELLPRVGQTLSFAGSAHCVNRALRDGKLNKLWLIPAVPLQLLYYGFRITKIAGFALTSPASSMKTGWTIGNRLGGKRGKVVGGMFAGVSGLVSMTEYALMFPLAIKAAAVKLPLVLTQSSAISMIGTYITKAVAPVYSLIGESVPAATSAIGSLLGAACTVSSPLVKVLRTKLANKVHHIRYPTPPIGPEIPMWRPPIRPTPPNRVSTAISASVGYCRTQLGRLAERIRIRVTPTPVVPDPERGVVSPPPERVAIPAASAVVAPADPLRPAIPPPAVRPDASAIVPVSTSSRERRRRPTITFSSVFRSLMPQPGNDITERIRSLSILTINSTIMTLFGRPGITTTLASPDYWAGVLSNKSHRLRLPEGREGLTTPTTPADISSFSDAFITGALTPEERSESPTETTPSTSGTTTPTSDSGDEDETLRETVHDTLARARKAVTATHDATYWAQKRTPPNSPRKETTTMQRRNIGEPDEETFKPDAQDTPVQPVGVLN